MPAILTRELSTFVLTNRRAEQDTVALSDEFPSVKFIAAGPDNWRDVVVAAHGIFLGRGVPVDEVLAFLLNFAGSIPRVPA